MNAKQLVAAAMAFCVVLACLTGVQAAGSNGPELIPALPPAEPVPERVAPGQLVPSLSPPTASPAPIAPGPSHLETVPPPPPEPMVEPYPRPSVPPGVRPSADVPESIPAPGPNPAPRLPSRVPMADSWGGYGYYPPTSAYRGHPYVPGSLPAGFYPPPSWPVPVPGYRPAAPRALFPYDSLWSPSIWGAWSERYGSAYRGGR